MKDFAKRVKGIGVSLIRQMPLWASGIPNAVSLGQGIPSFPLPQYIQEKLREAIVLEKDINKYSLQPGMPMLKKAIAKYLEQAENVKADPEKEILVTGGAISALFCAISSVVEQDDEVILLEPAYEPHIEQVKFAQGVPVLVPLLESEGWKPDFSAMRTAITKKTKAIIVCDPANPTGAAFLKEDLVKIAELAKEHDLFLITDETYDFLVYEGREHTSLLSFPEIQERIIACFSFSKKYAMTGFRVGYVYAKENTLKEISKVHDESSICAPTISQYAALFALTGPQDYVEVFRKEFAKRRELICKKLDGVSDIFEYQKPMGAYYVFPKLKLKMKSLDFSLKLLKEAGVITIPGVSFGPAGEGHIRLSFAGEEQIINEAFDRIEKYRNTLRV